MTSNERDPRVDKVEVWDIADASKQGLCAELLDRSPPLHVLHAHVLGVYTSATVRIVSSVKGMAGNPLLPLVEEPAGNGNSGPPVTSLVTLTLCAPLYCTLQP